MIQNPKTYYMSGKVDSIWEQRLDTDYYPLDTDHWKIATDYYLNKLIIPVVS